MIKYKIICSYKDWCGLELVKCAWKKKYDQNINMPNIMHALYFYSQINFV